jgi:hypothetical protein
MADDHPNEQKALQHRSTCRCAVVLTVSADIFMPVAVFMPAIRRKFQIKGFILFWRVMMQSCGRNK